MKFLAQFVRVIAFLPRIRSGKARQLGFMLLSLIGIAPAQAISIDLGPSRLITGPSDPLNSSVMLAVSFNQLNGSTLNGQAIGVDLLFANDAFIRVFTASPPNVNVALSLVFSTNAGGYPGLLGESTGSILNGLGGILASGSIGSWMGSDGTFGAALFPATLPNGSPTGELDYRPYDIYGVHYDLIFPNSPGLQITAAELRLVTFDPNPRFGIGPGVQADIVPDSGVSVVVLGLAFAGFALIRSRQRRSSERASLGSG